jgi:hypothetical protein
MGFLTGHEFTWMPEALQILRHELPNIDVMISSQYSLQLADGLSKGKIDAAFLRRERVSDPQALAFEIRRVGRSCLEEDPLKLGMHLSKRDYGVLESGAILILTVVDWMSTERACVDRTDQLLNKYADSSHRPACYAKFRWHALVHDTAGRLIFNFTLAKPNDPAQSHCSPRSMPDPDAFNPSQTSLPCEPN